VSEIAPDPPPSDPAQVKLHFLGLTFDPHRLIYSTLIIIVSLSIYGDSDFKEFTAGTAVVLSAVLIAPLFALTMAHAFSDALDMQIRLGRRLTGRDRRHILASNLEYMYIAVPPLLLIGVLGPTSVPPNLILDIIVASGLISLFLWGAFAARMARLGRWAQVRTGLSYSLMGLIVVVVELALTH